MLVLTARRIWQDLRTELGCSLIYYSICRFVRNLAIHAVPTPRAGRNEDAVLAIYSYHREIGKLTRADRNAPEFLLHREIPLSTVSLRACVANNRTTSGRGNCCSNAYNAFFGLLAAHWREG